MCKQLSAVIGTEYGANWEHEFVGGLLNQASRLRECGDLKRAEKVLAAALQLLEDGKHTSSSLMIDVLIELSTTQREQCRFDLAFSQLERALYLAVLPAMKETLRIAAILYDLSIVSECRRDIPTAQYCLEQALVTLEKSGYQRTRCAIKVRQRLSFLLMKSGDPFIALEMIEDALSLAKEILGEDPELMANCFSSHGAILNSLGRYESAIEQLQVAAETLESTVGVENDHLADIYELLHEIYKKIGRHEDSNEVALKAGRGRILQLDRLGRSAYAGRCEVNRG